LAAVLTNKGVYDEAMVHYRKAVACDPRLFDAHWGLAGLALITKQHELAASHFALAVEVNPRHAEAREGHVIALAKAGRYADAIASLEKSRKVLPRSMVLSHAAARLWATCPDGQLRDGPKALALAKALLRFYRSPEHAETLAMAFAETGNYDEARKWQKKTIELATSKNQHKAIPRLKKNLALYESGKPCRTPW
jgi:tetratricopeptide (TPR) repeat protein